MKDRANSSVAHRKGQHFIGKKFNVCYLLSDGNIWRYYYYYKVHISLKVDNSARNLSKLLKNRH